MKKTNETKSTTKQTPTYVRAIAAVLAALMGFSVLATVLIIVAQNV